MDDGASSYRRFLDGEEAAFDEIMESLFYSVVIFVDRFVRDIHAAEDIAIDVMSELVVHRHRYDFKVSLKTYLLMMARSRALDYIRRRRIIRFVGLDQAQEIPDGEALEERVFREDSKRLLHRAIAGLPEEMAQAVHLCYLEGLSYAEVAKVMKVDRKRVDNLLYRGKKALRDILGEDGELL
ncbi:MAG: RNA polymerase sigma factor [Oscillospiraceae bacterium]|nr:RNA polymerase sigma factor [Oscillospiraceae bacterium]